MLISFLLSFPGAWREVAGASATSLKKAFTSVSPFKHVMLSLTQD